MTQAIKTKFLSPTNYKGARVKASAWAGSVIISYDHSHDAPQAHWQAAKTLIEKLGWNDGNPWVQGGSPDCTGYYFVKNSPLNDTERA
jgi:hypothetical protein